METSFFGLDPEIVGEIALAILALGIIVGALIDLFKKFGWVKEDAAGKWNAVISSVTGLAILVLTQIGRQGDIAEAQTYALQIAAIVVSIFTIAATAKITHIVLKWLGPKA